MPLRYLLDEHVPAALRRELRRTAPRLDVRAIGEPGAPNLGTLDPDLLKWCELNDFALVTNNRRSMPRHLADHIADGGHVPGIFVLSPRRALKATVEEFIFISEASLESEHRDIIQYLPLV